MSEGTGIPVVSVVGKSDSGKTTLIERLIRALADRGYRVGSVKHHVHDFDIDVPGKDSWRHAKAGAAVTLVSSPSKLGMTRVMDHEATLGELLEYAADVDILLTEGYRRAGNVRIEVSRRARSTELVCEAAELFALVTDNADLEVGGVPVFGLDDAEGLADLVERTFLTGGRPSPAAEPVAVASRPAPPSRKEARDGD
jgi:molybdopterin-guanine dinucleotide biosynthesis protein MobB